jgi:hypothetical protein
VNPVGPFLFASILLLVLLFVCAIIHLIGRLLNKKFEQVEGIVLTKWTSHRSRVLNPVHPDNLLEEVLATEKPYYGYEIMGVKFDSVKEKILNSGEQIVAGFPGQARSLQGYFILADPEGVFLFSRIFVTNQGLIIWHPQAPEEKTLHFPYGDIRQIVVERGLIYCKVTLHTVGHSLFLDSFSDSFGLFSFAVRQQMAQLDGEA